jgi:hypothetical protein
MSESYCAISYDQYDKLAGEAMSDTTDGVPFATTKTIHNSPNQTITEEQLREWSMLAKTPPFDFTVLRLAVILLVEEVRRLREVKP